MQNYIVLEDEPGIGFSSIRPHSNDGGTALNAAIHPDTLMIEAPDHPTSEASLEAAMVLKPRAIVVRGISGIADIQHVSSRLAVHEALSDWPDGSIRIMAVIGDNASSIRSLTKPWPRLPRLSALIFSPVRLMAQLGCPIASPYDQWPEPVRLGRNLTVLMALELNLPAYEWISPDMDKAGAEQISLRDGFSGILMKGKG